MRDKIRRAVYLPVLKKIGFFGWDESDDQEEESIEKFFDVIDTSGNGSLDQDELKELFNKLELDLTVRPAPAVFCGWVVMLLVPVLVLLVLLLMPASIGAC